ncbi:MAG: nuclease [Deltaproteobacteria bacterium CG11_big_fil_rev_8_21_14_0_20_45_16]|nr:MAG: nuclease [Deltaproteobacteria bacterium CG11_big_fil_rev_8_21_14_0_20_45_16]
MLMCALVLIAPAFLYASDCSHDSKTLRCVSFVRNYDGDTITVDIPNIHPLFGKNISVRIRGIDTAEVKTKDKCEKRASRTARRLVEKLLKHAKRIDLLNIDRDKYFRISADVSVDGKLISEILIKNRLAVAYDGGHKAAVDWCTLTGSTENANTSPN